MDSMVNGPKRTELPSTYRLRITNNIVGLRQGSPVGEAGKEHKMEEYEERAHRKAI